jgi:hypothetical protein
VEYVKHELARGLGDWEQRLSTAMVKSSPTDLVRTSAPITVEATPTESDADTAKRANHKDH